MPIAQIKMIAPDGEKHDDRYNCTYYKYIYTFPNPNGGDDIRFSARHKTRDRFSVGDTVEYAPSGDDPNWGTVQNPQQGNFQNSRPASQPTAQPSSNGEPSFEEIRARAEEKRAKAIRTAVIFKEACNFCRDDPRAGMPACLRKARAMMQLCECDEIPQDNPEPVVSNEEIPF